MDFDEITQIWQTQKNEDVVINDEDDLKREVYKEYRKEAHALTWLSFQKGIVMLFLSIYFLKGAIESTSSIKAWTMYIAAFIVLGSPLFLLITTLQQRKFEMQFGGSVLEHVKRSLSHVNHRIWVLSNFFWWNLLPFMFSVTLVLGGVVYEKGFHPTVYVLICAMLLICYGGYRLGLAYVRKYYVPRKQMLEELLANMNGTE